MKRILNLLAMLILTDVSVCAQQSVKALFPCSEQVENAFGITADLTRKSGDYSRIDEALGALNSLKPETIRVPMFWDNIYQNSKGYVYDIYDAAMKGVKNNGGTEQLGIISAVHSKNLSAWTNPDAFREYLSQCVCHYKKDISAWELIPGIDMAKDRGQNVPVDKYLSALKDLRSLLEESTSESRIVLGCVNNCYGSFLDSLSLCGATDYFDVMNFSLGREPENIIAITKRIRSKMDKYGWEKPVWVTQASCSSLQQEDQCEGFWTEVVPKALEMLGFKPKSLEIAVVYDPVNHCCGLNEYQVNKYLKGRYKSVRYLTLAEVSALDPSSVPVLVPCLDSYSVDVANYIRKGGTVIMENAVWPTVTHAKTVASFFYEQAKAGAKQETTYCKAVDGLNFNYSWTSTKKHPARYLTADGLWEGDEMIPLMVAGNDGYEGVVAAIYKLGSAHNKGRVVIQARSGITRYVDALQEQAKRIARTYLVALSCGVDRVYWNKLRTSDKGELQYLYNGIVTPEFEDKPAAVAFRTMIRQLPAGSSRPQLTIKDGVYLCSWTVPSGERRWAVWCPGGTVKSNLAIDGKTVCYDNSGKQIKGLVTIKDGVTYINGARNVEFAK